MGPRRQGIGTFIHVLASGGYYPRGLDGGQGTGIGKNWGFRGCDLG